MKSKSPTQDKNGKKKGPPRVGPLNTVGNVMKLQRRSVREAVRTGSEREGRKWWRIMCMSSMLIKGIEALELEKRLEQVEERVNLKGKDPEA